MTAGDESRAESRILIADDHDSFRSGLRAVLGTADDLLVVGEATSDPKPSARSRHSTRTSC